MEVKLTNISDEAPRRQVQQELLHFGPGFVPAVVEIWSDLVIDTVHVVPLQLTGSLLHHVHPGCLIQAHSIVAAGDGRKKTIIKSTNTFLNFYRERKRQNMNPTVFLTTCLLKSFKVRHTETCVRQQWSFNAKPSAVCLKYQQPLPSSRTCTY